MFRKNFSILLFFVLLSVFWKLCEFKPKYGSRYGSYESSDSYERHGPRRRQGPHRPPPRQHDFRMRPQRPMMDYQTPTGMRRPGPDFPPPPMGPRGRHHHRDYDNYY